MQQQRVDGAMAARPRQRVGGRKVALQQPHGLALTDGIPTLTRPQMETEWRSGSSGVSFNAMARSSKFATVSDNDTGVSFQDCPLISETDRSVTPRNSSVARSVSVSRARSSS